MIPHVPFSFKTKILGQYYLIPCSDVMFMFNFSVTSVTAEALVVQQQPFFQQISTVLFQNSQFRSIDK